MNSEIPPSTRIAPIAIAAASTPVNPPPEDVEPPLVTTGGEGELGAGGAVAAGAVGVGAGACGRPGASGLLVP
jgi:hypothetical protein